MFSAAVLPVLARVLASGLSPRWQVTAVALGVALAVLVAVSRVLVSAHSPVESLLGFALGLAAAGCPLRCWQLLPPAAAPRLLVAGLAGWMLLMPTQAPASRTHDWVQQLAVTLSGRPQPYARWMMLRDQRRALHQRPGPRTGLPPAYRH